MIILFYFLILFSLVFSPPEFLFILPFLFFDCENYYTYVEAEEVLSSLRMRNVRLEFAVLCTMISFYAHKGMVCECVSVCVCQ